VATYPPPIPPRLPSAPHSSLRGSRLPSRLPPRVCTGVARRGPLFTAFSFRATFTYLRTPRAHARDLRTSSLPSLVPGLLGSVLLCLLLLSTPACPSHSFHLPYLLEYSNTSFSYLLQAYLFPLSKRTAPPYRAVGAGTYSWTDALRTGACRSVNTCLYTTSTRYILHSTNSITCIPSPPISTAPESGLYFSHLYGLTPGYHTALWTAGRAGFYLRYRGLSTPGGCSII